MNGMLAETVFFQDADPLMKLREVNTRLDRDSMLYRDTEIYLSKAWNSSPIPMWIKDLNGKMVFLNDAYCAIYGIRKSEYIGRTDFDVWPPEVAKEFRKMDSKVLNGESVEYGIEKIPSQSGLRSYDHLHVIKFPIKDGPKIVGIAGMITGVFP